MDDALIPQERATLEIDNEQTSEELFVVKRPFFRLYLWTIPVLVNLTDTYGDRKPRRAKAALPVYLALARHTSPNRRVRLRWPTISRLAGVSVGHVGRSIRILENAGLLVRWGQERGRCAVYEMTKDPPEPRAPARDLTNVHVARQRATRSRASAPAGRAPARNPLPDTLLSFLDAPSLEQRLQDGDKSAVAAPNELLEEKKSILRAIGLSDEEAAALAHLPGCTAGGEDFRKVAGIFNQAFEAGKIDNPIGWLRTALLNHQKYDSGRMSARNRVLEHRASRLPQRMAVRALSDQQQEIAKWEASLNSHSEATRAYAAERLAALKGREVAS